MDDHVKMLIVFSIVFLFMLAYSATLFFVLRKVPKEHRVFPAWFVWFFPIPLLGFIFQWIMTPFGIPFSLKNAVKTTNPSAVKWAVCLMYLGLIQVLLPTVGFFVKQDPYILFFSAAGLLTWVAYWFFAWFFKVRFLK